PAGPSAWRVTGTPADVADEISRWADVGAIDGAIGLPTGWTGSVLAFAEEVAPILADRGLLAH
ncbi:MAG: LLM class flavin-dependent oxidoreductase, partial [Microbacterium sp.]